MPSVVMLSVIMLNHSTRVNDTQQNGIRAVMMSVIYDECRSC
jgi:hypothetical protein